MRFNYTTPVSSFEVTEKGRGTGRGTGRGIDRGRGPYRGRGTSDTGRGRGRCLESTAEPKEYRNMNETRKYPHQNPDVQNVQNQPNYGRDLCTQLANFDNWPDLITELKQKLSLLKTEREKAGFFAAMLSIGLHEAFTDTELYEGLSSSYDTEYEKLPTAIWSTIWYRPHATRKFTKFSRNNDDIIETIKICLELGSNPLEINKHGENAFNSLQKCYEKLQDNGLTFETYKRIYDLLCTPVDGNRHAICSRICNTLSGGKTVQTSPNVKWIMIMLPNEFCRTIANNLMLTPETAKFRQIYQHTRQHLSLIKNMLSDENFGHFDMFFKEKNYESKIVTDKFCRTMISYCTTDGMSAFDIFSGNPFNKEIIGAIVGEIGTNKELIEFCRENTQSCVRAVVMALNHRKTSVTEFRCPEDIIDNLMALIPSQSGAVKFSINSCIELFLDSQQFSRKMKILESENKIHSIVIALDSTTTINEVSEKQFDDFSIESIRYLKSDAIFDNGQFNHEFLNDIIYVFEKNKKEFTNNLFLETVFLRIVENVSDRTQTNCIKKILEIVGLSYIIASFANNKGKALVETIDNPHKFAVLQELCRI